jgi:hypothetical protein
VGSGNDPLFNQFEPLTIQGEPQAVQPTDQPARCSRPRHSSTLGPGCSAALRDLAGRRSWLPLRFNADFRGPSNLPE